MLASVLAVFPSSALPASTGSTLRIFDPTGAIKVQVTSAEVALSTVRAVSTPTGEAALVGKFTARGRVKFCTLTRGVAKRGTRLHHDQHIAFAVAGHVIGRPTIQSRLFPNGLCGSPSFEVAGLKLAEARRLSRAIRG